MLPERKLNRLPNFNYSTAALYFITACVQNGEHYFGNVSEEEMHLNSYGKIADEQFLWLESQYPYLVLHTYVVMPNHVHAILEIKPDFQGVGGQKGGLGELDRECGQKGSDNVRTGNLDRECVKKGSDNVSQ